MVSALSYEISRVSHYSGFILPSLSFRLQDSHLLWSTFPDSSPNLILGFFDNPNPKCITTLGLGSSYFARHYSQNLGWFLFGSIPYSELNLAIYNNSLDRSTKSTISRLNSLYLLVNIGFQVLFHSPPGVLFTVPSRYLFSIGYQVVFSLTEWSPLFHTRFLVSRTTLDLSRLHSVFIYRTFTFFGLPSLVILLTSFLALLIIRTPQILLSMVWALPVSLATTSGIVVTFFSYGY